MRVQGATLSQPRRPDSGCETPDNVALLEAIARGDRAALARLYDLHASALLGVALRVLKNRQDAEDLVHDVFVEAWRKAGAYDATRGTVRRWLLVRLRSRAIDRVRSLASARRHGMLEERQAAAAVADVVWSGPDQARALAALSRLPEEQRVLVEFGYFEGLTGAEMAERCGIPLGTVKSRLNAAMTKLRRQLDPPEGSE